MSTTVADRYEPEVTLCDCGVHLRLGPRPRGYEPVLRLCWWADSRVPTGHAWDDAETPAHVQAHVRRALRLWVAEYKDPDGHAAVRGKRAHEQLKAFARAKGAF